MPFDENQPFEVDAGGKEFDSSQSFEVEPQRGAGAIKESFDALKSGTNLSRPALQQAKGALRSAGGQIGEANSSYRSHVLGMESDVDYDSGADYSAQKDLQRASNDEEAKLVLEKHYGEGNTGQDTHGRWWVTKDGKKTAVFGGGMTGALKKTAAGIQATVPEMGGMMLGAAAGAAGGPPGVVAGGVIGALGGKAEDEISKYFEGFYSKTPEELAEVAKSTLMWNSIFSGAGPVAKQVFTPAGKWLRSVLGVTPATRAMTERAMEAGVVPPISAIAPEFKSLADKQKLRNIVLGDPQVASRVSAVQSQARDALQSEGYTGGQVDRIMSEVFDASTALSESEVGKIVVPRVAEHTAALKEQANIALLNAQDIGANSKKLFEAAAKRSTGELGTDVAEALSTARSGVARAYEPAYTHVDEMVQGREIVPLTLAKKEAAFLSRNIPPDRVPSIFKEMADSPDMVTPSTAHRLRSQLRQMSDSHNLTPDVGNHEFGRLADSVDAGFSMATRRGNLPENVWQENKAGIDFMRKVDKSYGEEIRFYKDARVNELAKLADAGMPPDAEQVAGLISEVGYTDRTRQIIDKMPDELKRRVASADMKLMFDDTERMTAKLGFESSGKAFYNVVSERRPLLDAIYAPVYGKSFVDGLEKTAKELAALDGRLDLKTLEQKVQGLGPGAMMDALSERVAALKKLETFAKENPLAALDSGHPDAVDQAYRAIVQPKADARLKVVYGFFGEGMEMDAVRNHARKELIKEAVYTTPSRAQMVSGDAIESEFSKYSTYQKGILFPNGAEQDLAELAKMSRFLFPEEGDVMISQAAKSITLHTGPFILNPRTAYADARWGYVLMMGWLSDRPAVARMLAGVSKKEPSTGKRMMQSLFRWVATEQAHAGPTESEGGIIPPGANPTSGEFDPTSIGAKQAPDGNFYLPDPQRPGKYLQVSQ